MSGSRSAAAEGLVLSAFFAGYTCTQASHGPESHSDAATLRAATLRAATLPSIFYMKNH